MYPNTEFFLVRIFPHSHLILRDTKHLFAFSPNAGKYVPRKTPYLDNFHAVNGSRIDPCGKSYSILDHEDNWQFNTTLSFPNFTISVRVLKRLPEMLFSFNLKIRSLCHTLSQSLDISKNTDQTSWPSSKDL